MYVYYLFELFISIICPHCAILLLSLFAIFCDIKIYIYLQTQIFIKIFELYRIFERRDKKIAEYKGVRD